MTLEEIFVEVGNFNWLLLALGLLLHFLWRLQKKKNEVIYFNFWKFIRPKLISFFIAIVSAVGLVLVFYKTPYSQKEYSGLIVLAIGFLNALIFQLIMKGISKLVKLLIEKVTTKVINKLTARNVDNDS